MRSRQSNASPKAHQNPPKNLKAMQLSSDSRALAVLFIDLSRSTQLSQEMDLASYSRLMNEIRAIYRAVVGEMNGAVLRAQGDGVLAIFSSINLNETAVMRATIAATEIRHQVAQIEATLLNLKLTTHSAIHWGFVGIQEGGLEIGRLDLVGEVPNVCAKICAAAESGEILLSQAAIEADPLIRNELRVTLGSARALTVSAKQSLMVRPMIRLLRSYLNQEPNPYQFKSKFVGRKSHLDSIEKQFNEFLTTPNTILVGIEGPPGIGKSRLTEEAIVRLQTNDPLSICLKGVTDPFLSQNNLQPFLQIMKGLAQSPAKTAIPERAIKLLADSPLNDEIPNEELVQQEDVLNSLLKAAETHRIILRLEDWHWADDSSRSLLNEIVQRKISVFIVMTMRPSFDSILLPNLTNSIKLSPLSIVETEEIVNQYCFGAGPFAIQALHQYTSGNPLFIEECSQLGREFLTAIEEKSAQASELTTVSEVVAARLNNLPTYQKKFLQSLAIVGSEATALALTKIVGEQQVDLALAELVHTDHLSIDNSGRLQFKHAIVRDVIYAETDENLRQVIHLKVASLISLDQFPGADKSRSALIGFHYLRGGLPEMALEHLERAGEKNLQESITDLARRQFFAAIEALNQIRPRTPELLRRRCLITQKLGMASVFDPISQSEDFDIFRGAVSDAHQLEDLDLIARAQYWLGYMLYARGRGRQAGEHLEAALHSATKAQDPKLVAQISAVLGQNFISLAQYNQAIPLLEDAISTKARLSRPGSSLAIGSAYTLACRAGALADQGEYDLAHADFNEAKRLLGSTDHVVYSSIQNWVVLTAIWQEELEVAEAAVESSLVVATRTRSSQLSALAKALESYVRFRLRRDASALADMHEASAWLESRNETLLNSMIYGFATEMCVESGDFEKARYYFARLLRRARQRDLIGFCTGCRAMVQHWKTSDPQRANRYLDYSDSAAQLRKSPREIALNKQLRGAF